MIFDMKKPTTKISFYKKSWADGSEKIHDFVSNTVFYFLLSSACFYGAIHENFSPMSDNFGQKK